MPTVRDTATATCVSVLFNGGPAGLGAQGAGRGAGHVGQVATRPQGRLPQGPAQGSPWMYWWIQFK